MTNQQSKVLGHKKILQISGTFLEVMTTILPKDIPSDIYSGLLFYYVSMSSVPSPRPLPV